MLWCYSVSYLKNANYIVIKCQLAKTLFRKEKEQIPFNKFLWLLFISLIFSYQNSIPSIFHYFKGCSEWLPEWKKGKTIKEFIFDLEILVGSDLLLKLCFFYWTTMIPYCHVIISIDIASIKENLSTIT